MTKLEKAKFLDERDIEHYINPNTGEMFALAKMTASDGNDCSEWLPACDIIEAIQEQERYFKL